MKNESKPAPFLGTVTAVTLVGLVPLVVLANTPEPYSDAWMLALASTALAGAMFSLVVSARVRQPFSMATWLFFYSFLGLAPLVQLRETVDPETTRGLAHQFDTTALWVVLVSEVSLVVGSLVSRSGTHREPSTPRLPDARRTRALATASIVLGLGYIIMVGPSILFESRQSRDMAIAALLSDDLTRTIVGAVVSMGLLVTTIAQRLLLTEARGFGVRVLLVVSAVTLLIIVNPFGSPRYVFGTVALALLAAFGMFRSVARFRALALGAIAGIIVVFPALDSFRYASSTSLEQVDPLSALTTADFDGFAQIVNTVEYVALHGATAGNQLLGVVLFWVPRSWWAEKPTDTGILIAESKGYSFTNLSAPLPAELFINGGWAAVVVGMTLLGFWMRRWDARTEASITSHGVPSLLGSILPFYMILLLRGSLLQAMASLSVILLFAWAVGWRAQGLDSRRPREIEWTPVVARSADGLASSSNSQALGGSK